MCQHILTREAASPRLMPGGAISGLVDLNEGGLGEAQIHGRWGEPPHLHPYLQALLPLGLDPQQAAQKMLLSSLVSELYPPPQLPPAREQAGRREGRFIQRSELCAPALGSHPITLTGQFTGQLCSEG